MKKPHSTALLVACVASLAISASARASTGAQMLQARDRIFVSYACDNGAMIDATFVTVDGLEAAIVLFPDGRHEHGFVRRLLPATQTGSGVRYASDISELHIKGGEASFEAAASALSEAVARTQCREMHAPGDEPLTQQALSGRYLAARSLVTIPELNEPAYRRAENVCFADSGDVAIALTPVGVGRQALLDQWQGFERSSRPVEVGEVDAGVGQRRYALSDIHDAAPIGVFHFIARGMVEPDGDDASALLASITLGEAQARCLDLSGALYSAHLRDGQAVIRMRGGTPMLELRDASGATRHIAAAFMADDDASRHFLFSSDEELVQVTIPRPTTMSGNRIVRGTGPSAGDFALAVFIADAVFDVGNLQAMPEALGDLLTRLPTCNHLAGEWSGEPDRDAQLPSLYDSARCDAIDEDYDVLLRSDEIPASIRDFLASNPPVWR